jgi:hypothetical protein
LGINSCFNPVLADLASRMNFSGRICTLGVMDLSDGVSPDVFLSRLGFSEVESLDVSDYEGATHVFDPNSENLPEHLTGRFDAVLNGGTLGHVFHVPNALTSITRMLRPHGMVIHILPCNGWVNHGFYQIGLSP